MSEKIVGSFTLTNGPLSDAQIKERQQYLKDWASAWSVDVAEYSECDLVCFLDEAGNPKPSVGHPSFFFCGIVALGADVAKIRHDWRKLRKAIWNLEVTDEYSSAKHLRHLAKNKDIFRLKILEDFLKIARFIPLYSLEHADAVWRSTDMASQMAAGNTFGMIKEQTKYVVDKLGIVFDQEIWFIENSTALPPLILENMMTGENYWTPPSGGVSFLDRRAAKEPCLDLADLQNFLFRTEFNNIDVNGVYQRLFKICCEKRNI